MELKMKRIYESPTEADGFRILVDRLWPRGVKKENAQLDAWLKDSAPSPDLRKWFDHDPDKFAAFKERYEEELLTDEKTMVAVAEILKQLDETDVTLVYAAKDPDINHVVVLKELLERQLGK
ncbi:uncharacterized protein YeaO (DUF488 family) [Trichococcus patagoniensis]|uniref:Uncharacterized protein YeaO (DUF488 family) n=1 Tax=Trichococcus patagoniensis TaxID=382641 RepID=A0A2T5IGQ2_9LACT|nr:DUF488 family protein [Trichococcus patagoniensis]PTQ82982.1 uncharacterized protein YeaO (DUF488 family) [Trichococcus patagoniensis]